MKMHKGITPDGLNAVMETDHVVEVHTDGTVSDAPGNVWAPELCDQELSGAGWEFFSTGYTGQDSYTGPIMHNSEQLTGRLARDILAQPGYYVALVSDYSCDDECEDDCEEDHTEGWAVAYRPLVACQSILSDTHSQDLTTVYVGTESPRTLCGYHASREYPQR